ncbi:MAG: TetR/AcrR family transcriptional regulator [Alphaproteobacteria bacterium]|nr:TetR/AcrR family transcriptional regulator [Alphaproteobacteria bacterium]
MESRERILAAAAVEFTDRGFHGVRMEHVSKRAALNKSLVYRHFDNKETLFEQVLRAEIGKRTALLDTLPDSLGEILVFWAAQQREDADFNRLIGQEGLRDDAATPVAAEERTAYYRRQIDRLRTMQEEGALAKELDPEGLFFALLLLTVGPVLLPQLARLILGDDVEAHWDDTLRRIAERLEGGHSETPSAAVSN